MRGMLARVRGALSASRASRVNVREILGSPRTTGGGLLVERNPKYPCDRCGTQRKVSVTVLTVTAKGNSRPRFSSEAHPIYSICWDCLCKRMLYILTFRARKPR